MSWITLTGVGVEGAVTSEPAANPQLQFFENFPGHLGVVLSVISDNTLSIHAVNIPLSISFNVGVILARYSSAGAGTAGRTYRMGLYSMNANTLSLANSAIGSSEFTLGAAGTIDQWVSLLTSASQNITPGTWYWALVVSSANGGGHGIYRGPGSIDPSNAVPGGFLMGRMTATTGIMPASIATSDLDITGSDAIRQPYIIITA